MYINVQVSELGSTLSLVSEGLQRRLENQFRAQGTIGPKPVVGLLPCGPCGGPADKFGFGGSGKEHKSLLGTRMVYS
jgi:hypothetical protein